MGPIRGPVYEDTTTRIRDGSRVSSDGRWKENSNKSTPPAIICLHKECVWSVLLFSTTTAVDTRYQCCASHVKNTHTHTSQFSSWEDGLVLQLQYSCRKYSWPLINIPSTRPTAHTRGARHSITCVHRAPADVARDLPKFERVPRVDSWRAWDLESTYLRPWEDRVTRVLSRLNATGGGWYDINCDETTAAGPGTWYLRYTYEWYQLLRIGPLHT